MAESTTEKSRDQQINDLATRVATEFKTTISKSGNRGTLAGYETPSSASSINGASNDTNYSVENVTVANGDAGTSWTKTVLLTGVVTVTLGSSWAWVGGEAPTITANSVLVLYWNNTNGIAGVVSPTA